MTRWTTTVGQRIQTTRLKLFAEDSAMPDSLGNQAKPAKFQDISDISDEDEEPQVFEPQAHEDLQNLVGIEWISSSPNLAKAKHISFTESKVAENHSLAAKTVADIQSKVAAALPEFFPPQVIQNWHDWKLKQQELWDPLFHAQNPVIYSDLVLPRTFFERAQTVSSLIPASLQDSARIDLQDDAQIITFDSGIHGRFTKQERLESLQKRVLKMPECSKTEQILEGKGCIFNYTHVRRGTDELISQIGVGIIEKVHGNPSSPDALLDIRFCPPKGAKPQKGNRPDTLYQDINADMCFNLNYKSKKGTKIEKEDMNLERDVLLAFNLDINKSSGTFNKLNLERGNNVSSYNVATDVIELFYSSKKCLKN
jgi:hypothetical protein